MRHSSKKRRSFRYVPEKMLAFSRESDRINVKLFLRCGQMFAKKRRAFLQKDKGMYPPVQRHGRIIGFQQKENMQRRE